MSALIKRDCDVLVIGGGETGIRAAVEAKLMGAPNVLLTSKGKFGSSGVMFSDLTFGWDMQAATSENDSTDSKDNHLQDIMRAAQGTCSEKLARIVVDEAPDRLKDLQNLFGLELYRRKDGTPRQVYGCFSTKDRSYQFIHPEQIKQKMSASLIHYGVELLDEIMITKLLKKGSCCVGALGLYKNGEQIVIRAKSVILAAGGATGIYKHNFASPDMCGDGYALALEAGCTLANMEFLQFGLGLLEPKYRGLFLDRLMYLHPDVRFEFGHHFPVPVPDMMTVHSKHFPFSTIDESYLFDVAVFKETLANKGRGVAVDLSVIPMQKLKEIPVWELYYNYFNPANNPYDNLLRITSFAHACNGGVVIDENAATAIQGLYAAGEMASGPHGANRLGGNMHAACQVFGTRAGRNAAKFASGCQATDLDVQIPEISCSLPAISYCTQIGLVADAIWTYGNVVRNSEGLKTALMVIDNARRYLSEGIPGRDAIWNYFELKSTVIAAEAIVRTALEREETRGSHYREDFPETCPVPYVLTCTLEDEKLSIHKLSNYPD